MRWVLVVMSALVVALAVGVPGSADAATCSGYGSQAEAQRAADTRDADGDGVYCESLPCPCSTGGGSGGSAPAPSAPPLKATCTRPRGVQRIVFGRAKYPNIRRHYVAAVRKGWPRVMVLNRKGTDARRDRLLQGVPTKPGFDRDEYPAAVGRGRANGDRRSLVRGVDPRGWMADVMYVPSAENRSHGSSLGSKLRAFCDGTRFRYLFR